MPGLVSDPEDPEHQWEDVSIDLNMELGEDWEGEEVVEAWEPDEVVEAEEEGPQPDMPGAFQVDEQNAAEQPGTELLQHVHPNPGYGVHPLAWNAGEDEGEMIQGDEENDDDEEDDDDWVPMPQHLAQPGAPPVLPEHWLLQNMTNEAIVACIGFTPFTPTAETIYEHQTEA